MVELYSAGFPTRKTCLTNALGINVIFKLLQKGFQTNLSYTFG